MSSFRTNLITLAAVAALAVAPGMPALAAATAGGNACLTDQQIQVQISSGEIQSWPKIKKLAGISTYEEVSDVRVCLKNGTPYYNVNVVSPNGEARKIVLNAVDGAS